MTLVVLRHHCAEIGPEAEIGDRNRLAVEAVDRKIPKHDDAAAVAKLAADVIQDRAESTEIEILPRDLYRRNFSFTEALDRRREIAHIRIGDAVAPGIDVLQS